MSSEEDVMSEAEEDVTVEVDHDNTSRQHHDSDDQSGHHSEEEGGDPNHNDYDHDDQSNERLDVDDDDGPTDEEEDDDVDEDEDMDPSESNFASTNVIDSGYDGAAKATTPPKSKSSSSSSDPQGNVAANLSNAPTPVNAGGNTPKTPASGKASAVSSAKNAPTSAASASGVAAAFGEAKRKKRKGMPAGLGGSRKGRAPAVRGLTIPFRTVKKAMKLDPDIPIVQNEAAIMTTLASELFLKALAESSYENAKARGRNTIRYEDVAEARTKKTSLSFLETLLP